MNKVVSIETQKVNKPLKKVKTFSALRLKVQFFADFHWIWAQKGSFHISRDHVWPLVLLDF
jgi:hypothetical protein